MIEPRLLSKLVALADLGLHALKGWRNQKEIVHSALYQASDASSFTTGTALLADGVYRSTARSSDRTAAVRTLTNAPLQTSGFKYLPRWGLPLGRNGRLLTFIDLTTRTQTQSGRFQQYENESASQKFVRTVSYAAYLKDVEPLLSGPPQVTALTLMWSTSN